MAGCRIQRGFAPRLSAAGLSLVVHFAFIGVVTVLPMPAVTPVAVTASGGMRDPGPVMDLAWETPPEAPKPEPTAQTPAPLPVELVQVEPPKPEPVPAPPPTPPEQMPLKLGIAESAQESPNWIGFADPTEHKARQSTVEQPALDPKAGAPGEPAMSSPQTAAAEPAPVMPEAMPAERASPTKPVVEEPGKLDLPPREGPLAKEMPPEGAVEGEVKGPKPEVTGPEPKSELAATGPVQEAVTELRPRAGEAGAPSVLSFVGPMPLDLRAALGGGGSPASGQNATRPGADNKARDAKEATAPAQLVANMGAKPKAEPTPRGPEVASPEVPKTATPSPGVQAQPAPNASMSGTGAAKPAEESEKESEATSLEETIEVRLGRPAASQGLEIITRRPSFTGLTVVTANPRNPLIRVVFGKTGEVVEVEVLETSGVRDIDEPVVNAAYLWKAKGPALERIKTDSLRGGLSVKIRILLR